MRLFGSKSELVEFNNPFNKDSISSIYIQIMPGLKIYGDYQYCMKAFINFKKGNTTGSQEIYSNDFVELVLRTQNFIDGL